MLRFHETPDKVFIEIIRTSLEVAVDVFTTKLEGGANDEKLREDFEYIYPYAGKVFHPKTARDTLRKLLDCLFKTELYYLNDYHYLLLHDALEYFISWHNDAVRIAGSNEEKREMSEVGPFHIEEIDFDLILAIFFFDTDFLLDSEAMLELGEAGRDYLAISPETFGLAQGLAPHAEELVLRVVYDEPYEIPETPDLFGPESKIYPDMDRIADEF